MALEPGSRSSRASSPLPPRSPSTPGPPERDITKKDPKYKRFAASIERALALFDTNALQDWADYISFLGRLLKALQSHPSLPHIPFKDLVAKRLAQCLNPRLPSGVHQKTLEVYSFLFQIIGKDGLESDLMVWTPGLTPVLSYASINVKPHYLSLIETYFIPLRKSLRPILKSLILSLLPGIDEEGGEYFDQTLELLESLRRSIDDEVYFWQCFLLSTMTSAGKRQGALVWMSRKLPKLDGEEGLTSALVSPEPGMLIRAFCAGLQDDQILVQRGFLDLLVGHLPLKCPVLQKLVNEKDLQLLVTAAVSVVLRRDMSLNRRLWVWFLGPDTQDSEAVTPATPNPTDHFRLYGARPLINSLIDMINTTRIEPSERAKPYRICLSLMDRWEVGAPVIPKVFLPIIRSVVSYEKIAPTNEQFIEVLRSAAMFFDGVESRLIWSQIFQTIHASFKHGSDLSTILEGLELLRFIIRKFNVRDEEMITIHAPLATLTLIIKMHSGKLQSLKPAADKALELCLDILPLISPKPFTAKTNTSAREDLTAEMLLGIVKSYYAQNSKVEIANELHSSQMGVMLLREACTLVQKSLEDQDRQPINSKCTIFEKLVKLIPRPANVDMDSFYDSVSRFVTQETVPFPALQGVSSLAATLYDRGYIGNKEIDNLIMPIVQHIWSFLSPKSPKFHVEAVQSLWNLQEKLKDQRIEAAISSLMVKSDLSGHYPLKSPEMGRKFGVLWAHSLNQPAYEDILTRPLFLFLDELAVEGKEYYVFARAWLQNLPTTSKLFNVFVTKLLGFKFLQAMPQPGVKRPVLEDDEVGVCTYYLQAISTILKYSTNTMLSSLATDAVVRGNERREQQMQSFGFTDEITLQVFFATMSMRAVDCESQTSTDPEFRLRVSLLQRAALSVLQQLYLSPYSQELATLKLEVPLISKLQGALDGTDAFVQVSLLDVLYLSLKASLQPIEVKDPNGKPSFEIQRKSSRMSFQINSGESERPVIFQQPPPPQQLITCLVSGLSSPGSRPVLDSWINFLIECLPLMSEILFQVLLDIVGCFCRQLKLTFETIRSSFENDNANGIDIEASEQTLVSLLNGLEQVLAAAHEKLVQEEAKSSVTKNTHEPTGFFGNMISGAFAVESPQIRNATANNRLTVLLCFQDTVRVCYKIWSWGDGMTQSQLDSESLASFQYTSHRMRSRARRILEHMFAAETLECIETLIELWPARPTPENPRTKLVLKLINVLDGSRPKHTIPAIFNAIYSRTNPAALDQGKKSTLTSELTELEVASFLVEYANSLEDDTMDEIWTDCTVFLKDVLANPFPHRSTLPCLLEFTSIIGVKVGNTNFGEQKRLRKDFADLFLRLLSSTATVRPPPPLDLIEPSQVQFDPAPYAQSKVKNPDDILEILVDIVPSFPTILADTDRLNSCVNAVSSTYISLLLRAKNIPPRPTLVSYASLLTAISTLPSSAQKIWRKDLSDFFSDTKFLNIPPPLLRSQWTPLLSKWVLTDREKLPDLLSRLTPPAAAGVLFGVGAASARADADRRTDQTITRIILLLLSCEMDTFLPNLPQIEAKIVELLDATPTSSPSSATRSTLLILIRALLIKISPQQLSSLWPIINSELEKAFKDIALGTSVETSAYGVRPTKDSSNGITASPALENIRQARILLTQILSMDLDDFLPLECLYMKDSIDAVYSSNVSLNSSGIVELVGESPEVDGETKAWARGLAVEVFEARYRGDRKSVKVLEDGVWADLFDGRGDAVGSVQRVGTPLGQ